MAKRTLSLPAVTLSLLCLACAHRGAGPASGDPPPEVAARIADLEDRREVEGLDALVRAPLPATRARALRALARVQDLQTVPVVLSALADSDDGVRDEAAFAAGELALAWEPLTEPEKTVLLAGLTRRLDAEKAPQVRRTLLESLAKLATPAARDELVRRLAVAAEPAEVARAALSLGVVGRRGTPPLEPGDTAERAGWVALVDGKRSAPERYAGAYLLGQVKRPWALDALRGCLADGEPDVRALCAKGLGDAGGPEDAAVLRRLLADEVARVAAQAARSLARLAARCSAPCTPLEALEAGLAPRLAAGDAAAVHAALVVAQTGLPGAHGRGVLEALRRAVARLDAQAQGPLKADAAWLDCRLAAAVDRGAGALGATPGCGFGRVAPARALALALRELAQGEGGAEAGVQHLGSDDRRVRAAALELVGTRRAAAATEAVRALTRDPDLVLAAGALTAAAALRDAQSVPALRDLAVRVVAVEAAADVAEPVATALAALAQPGPAGEPALVQRAEAEGLLQPWLHSSHANVRRVGAAALAQLTGAPVRARRVALPAAARRGPAAPAGARLTFQTDKGAFTVALDAADAPLTAGNLWSLAKQGYFDGVTFHRVVPDFVAQGGDPRGDGEGGPGYSIRCEMTRRPYARATLGMALSGKDTGGSQFFFTHSPQPHLDGRYTAFGEVVEGMDVVDALSEGDAIRSVRAEPQ